MAGNRSNLPLRLQQILSGGRSVSPVLKLESEPPPKVKAFIDRVIKSPLHDIAIPLSGFRWEYNKGNFHHWRPLFMHFDTYFKTYLSCRKDLLLSDNIVEEDPFPKHSIMQILRVMQVILENCHNKSSFGGLEVKLKIQVQNYVHNIAQFQQNCRLFYLAFRLSNFFLIMFFNQHFKLLLASTDPDILIATLETLSALVRINPSKMHLGGKLIGCGSTNSYLLSLAQGWGSKEEGLGLHSCVVANERNQHEGLCLFPSDLGDNCDGTQHRLGSTLHFEYNMGSSIGTEGTKPSNIHVIKIPDLHLRKEDDLGILKQCVDQFNVPPEHRFSLLTRIRFAHAFRSPRICRLYSRISILAFVVLVQSNDAHDELVSFFANEPEYTNELIRLVRSEDCVPGTIRALAMLALGAQLAAYASSHERARILSGSSIISAGGNRMMLLNVLQKAIVSLSNPSDPSTPVFVDALLQFFLLHVLSSSSSGSAIRGSGMVHPLLPLLQDSDPAHIHLVSSAVKTLQKLMEYSSQAVSLFKDLGGIELLAQRLQIEVHRIIGSGEGSSNTVICTDLGKSDADHMYLQKRLIKFLLKTLGSATYSPANATRAHNSHHNSLLSSLSLIFNNVNWFGGDIYFSAVSVMSEIIHKDPTCFPVLNELGVPESFLSSVNSGIIPSSKALICVPNGLGAICLNAKGLEAVKETAVLRFLVEAFTTRKYLVAMNEGVVLLANAVEELLRHVSSLRGAGVEIIIEIVNKLASMGEEKCKETADDMNENTAMETDLEEKANEGHDLVSAMDLAADSISDEQFEQLSIFHVMVLVHRTMENSETCRMFVEKGGIETLLRLLQRPSITQSSDGMPIALHSTVVFKGFTQHHSAPLAHAFSSSLRGHLMKALNEFSSVSGSLLQDTKSVQDNGIFSSLFVVEFLLFLAASKDNRWMSALLTEFGDSSKDVLEDIGRVHREVLWQIALLEDSKVERDYDSSSSDINVDPGMVDSEEQRIGSFRQYLDPLLRRRVSGWSIESQFSDLVSIYRDLGRAATGSHRHGIDGYSTLRVAPTTRSQPSNSLDTSSASKTEEDKQRSYYSLCHETMRSLCYHINHLFMELGKAMLLTLRRENNPVNVSPSIVSVVGTVASIVLGHLNFAGRVSAAMESEVSVSTKCRYLGKVIDFVSGILFDRPEISNPIMVKCFFGHGVIQAVLTTFEATSQLLFTINRMPASPMDMDDKCQKEEKEESDNSWISGPLASYGTLLDHLATSSSILSSSTKQLLEQPIANGSISFPQDAETFVKVLQSKVLKAVLPIWTHPHFAECNLEFITSMISIMKHVYIGVEVRNVSGNAGAHLPGPPPDESAISLIVEMGFSRARAEEALRQVGTNSVEIATDWLFSHPEEPQEDDELARAVAMSLGNSDTSLKEDEILNAGIFDQEEEAVQLPPVDEILSACIRLLQVNEPLAFPIRDLLVMICSQNDGEHRLKVLSYIIDHVKHCCVPSAPLSESMLSALFHVLALVLHEDFMAREIAFQAGLVKIALDLLSGWNLGSSDGEKSQVPKWVTACLLSVDQMLQVDPKMTPGAINLEQLKKDKHNSQNSVVIDENRKKDLQSSLGSTTGNLDIQDQRRLLEICCRCIQNQLPSETMHVVLQLCSTLTKVHTIAVSFLDSGGLHALLSLPSSSLFPGFNNVAAAIIRHILEDPHTLQQAMELEIRHSLIAATNRHSNARVSPRTFVQNLAIVISRDPVVFLKAAQAVCQIEMVGDRPNIVLLKDREKERSKAKDKEKTAEKDKVAASDGKTTGTEVVSVAAGSGHSKLPDLSVKNTKAHRKSPQSFTSVIEYLLDLIVKFVPPSEVNCHTDTVPGTPSLSDMDIDSTSAKGKEKVIAVSSEDGKITTQEALASLAKIAFIIKLLTEILLTYASSIHVLLRKDAELSSSRATSKGLSGNSSGGIFHHILHNFLPYPGIHKKDKKTDGDWRHKLATRANQFLVASSVRSTEGRRRIFSEISRVFNDLVDSSNNCRAADSHMHAFVDLLNDILAARSPTGSYISAEASVTFIDVGLVRSLSRTLQVLDLDHADSPKLIPGIIKVLELVTKEHVHSAYINSAKGDNSLKLASNEHQVGSSDFHGERFQALEMASQPDHTEVVADQREAVNGIQTSGNYHSDDMEHDRELDGNFAREAEDDFMHEASEDGTGLENGVSTVEIRFEIPQNAEDDMGDEDDDEDMSGDEGEVDEDDEDDEENNDLEEDEVHQMSHPDTDHDDHEIDDEEFDEDVLEEEDDDDDDDDGVILRLEEGFSGINVFDHIEVLGGDNFSVMPLDIFGSRRQGRTTSIYNLIGRTGDHGALHFDHPLLEEPSSFRQLVHQRQSENAVDIAYSDRNHESASYRMNAIFRTLRNGRHGHRFNMWLDDNHQRGTSSAPAVPQGIEELLVSQLRQPTVQISDQNIPTNSPQETHETSQLQMSEVEVREEAETRASDNNENITLPSRVIGGSGNASVGSTNGDIIQDAGVSATGEQVTEMQYERGDVIVRDVEAVSQASSGSGATLGESLRSLEVEIGSVDGHDDGDRPGPVDRLPLGDLQPPVRLRRSSGNPVPVSGRDTSLESVSEVPQHQDQETDRSAPHEEPQPNGNVETDTIDPTFLEALPEELRAEVLSSRQNQVAQTSSEQPQADGDIDPEFLAALPPDIREEVLAQQRAQRRQQAQQLEGQPVEMDAVSIIATLPSEIREEVLLTSPDTLLATLTPALVAEANLLRERFAHRHHSGTLFGMSSRNRRGESSRHGETIGSTLDRTVEAAARGTAVGKLIETDGIPLVDIDDLKAMIRLLRMVQPLYKGQLQRLLLNLCTHYETRTSLVKILMDMLMLELRGSINNSVDSAESPFRLYGCQSHVAYSRPQFNGGVPPLVSRRILETLTYLARNHPKVSKLLLHLELPCTPACLLETSVQARGKAVLMEEDKPEDERGAFAIVLLLRLLSQPLYMRSVAHLEQLLNLVEVIIVNGESDSGLSNKPGASLEQQSGSENTTQDAQVTADAVGSAAEEGVKSVQAKDSERASTSRADNVNSISDILLSIPEGELQLLCSLLAREGLSDNAYVLLAEVLKMMVASAPTYCRLFTTELVNAARSLSVCAMNELNLYEDAEKALLSSSSTNGTAILRVLQALSSLVTGLHEKAPDVLPEKGHTDALSHVWDINAALEPLWLELSNCISKIEISSETPSDMVSISGNLASTSTPLPAGAQNILPYIESFFVTCEKLRPGQCEVVQDFATTSDIEEATTPACGQKSSGACTSTDEKHVVFVRFLEKHRKLLNSFIRQNPGLLEKSFSLMLKVPRFIDFDNKRAHFRSKIRHQHDHHHSPVRISVRRAYILEDSYNQLRMRSPQDLKGKLTVHFQGEEGIDAGGLTREWYQLLSRVIFDKGALLFTTVGNESTFQPNPNSVYQTEHLSYFKFVGRVVGKALFDGQLLDVHFTRSFYKHILGVKVTYHDIEAVDPDYFKNLKWMLENDISDVLDLTFSMDADEEKLILYERAEVTDCELIPGGRNIRVTEENKHEYVDRVAEHLLTTAIRPQINAFMEGFNELIPRELISIFNDKELELLISGLPDIDLDDLRANTEYSGYSNASPVIQWFWEVIQGFSKEDKARFLQFVTGTSKVPLEGFSALQGISGSQRFQIHKAYGSPHHLPSAHTCFNQLDLPEYTSKEQLQERLLLAIHEANEGFGFG
ncbi:E3 ubiquitin-protein ligase UPL1 isoform X1 [Musa acuminata AAA Group]|uniref:E3 ubiquitin-protein ligase UPL1 isoform X1 n=1 Tax=Musa acuminata AAA Group TaxID=214697 RepID=UPI0031D0B519